MSDIQWIKSVRQANHHTLTPAAYYACFDSALDRMAKTSFNGSDRRHQLNYIEIDPRISDEEAAERDFYSDFDYRASGGVETLTYSLTRTFFTWSYEELYAPTAARHPNETDDAFLADCASNYLLKNFWHNHVHERLQGITSSNYGQFGGEARFASDFEADNMATVLLAISYGLTVRADSSDTTTVRTDLRALFERNRCNNVFVRRADLRGEKLEIARSYDQLLEREWLIRRRFANQLGMMLAEGNRAAASLSIHFFGDIVITDGVYNRPHTVGAVEINRRHFPLGELGDVSAFDRDALKIGIPKAVCGVDFAYSSLLRTNPELQKYATNALEAKVKRLVNRGLDGRWLG